MRGRTLIRKTSLLRKIEPIARRSSFANRIIYNPLIHSMNERRNDLEIVIGKRELLRRSQTRIDLLFTMSKIPQPRPLGARMRSDVFADVCFLSRSSARLRSLELRRGSLRKKPCRAEAGIASEGWWSQTGSNRRPHACKARALPAELWPRTRRRML